jgi:ArsR family transcriptional regulator
MSPRAAIARLVGRFAPDLFRALAEPNRVAILAHLALARGEQSVTEVARCCPVNLSVVSRHLKTLREAGLLVSERRGKEVYYRAQVQRLAAELRALADALDGCCPEGACCGPATEDDHAR